MSWLMISNAFLRSTKRMAFIKPLSILVYHLSVISNNVVEVECKGLKPDCDSESTLLSHKNL